MFSHLTLSSQCQPISHTNWDNQCSDSPNSFLNLMLIIRMKLTGLGYRSGRATYLRDKPDGDQVDSVYDGVPKEKTLTLTYVGSTTTPYNGVRTVLERCFYFAFGFFFFVFLVIQIPHIHALVEAWSLLVQLCWMFFMKCQVLVTTLNMLLDNVVYVVTICCQTMLYICTVNVNFYQVKMLMFYDVQTTNLAFVGKK